MRTSNSIFCVLFLAAITAGITGCGPQERIAVVRTWGDILNQPVIELTGGVKVRLGIESRECSRYGGVLLYCFTEGYRPPERYEGANDRLGPVRVVVTDDFGGCAQPGQIARTTEREWLLSRSPKLLFARAIVPGETGTVHVQVLSPAGEPLGSFTLARSTDPDHPFLPLELAGTDHKSGGRVAIRDTAAAVPAWDPLAPIPYQQEVLGVRPLPYFLYGDESAGLSTLYSRWSPLPRLIPSNPDSNLRLQCSDSTLSLEADSLLITGLGEANFLARVWINNRPIVCPGKRTFVAATGTRVGAAGHIQFQLDPDLSQLGAKKGDRIGIQLLYCPQGWVWAGEGPLMQFLPGFGNKPSARLTNRVQFNLP